MAETFPSGLQQKFNEAGFNHTLGDSTLESDTDVGPPKKRRRYTTEYDEFSGTIELERTDYLTLTTFYKTTLAGGTLTFNFDHPITGVESEFQFISPPTMVPLGGTYFRVTFNWREIP